MSFKDVMKIIVLYTLFQVIVVWWVFYYIYNNYNQLTASDSWISDKDLFQVKREQKNVETTIKKKLAKNEKVIYEGLFWSITFKDSFIKNEKMDKNEKTFLFNIDYQKLQMYEFIIFLSEKKLIDTIQYNNFLNQMKEKNYKADLIISDYLNSILNLSYLIWYFTKNDWAIVLNDYNLTERENYKKYLDEWKYEELGELLVKLEQKYNDEIQKIPDYLFTNNIILENERFRYILKQVSSWNLYLNIDKVSNELWVDKKLIQSVIAVEQLRHLSTDRWQIKKVIQNNLPLVSFTKFSFWLAWIKTETYKTIRDDLLKYTPDLYNKYFKGYGDEVWDDTSKIINLLVDETKGMYYIGWLLLNIHNKWKEGWVDISNRPEIIITLYNIWNAKTPRQNPESWWAYLNILNGEKWFYFGDLWAIFYYYIKLYWERK